MAAFDRDDRELHLQHGRSYPMLGRRDYTTAWIAGIVAVIAIVGVFTYESGYWGTHATSTSPVTETTAPPPVNSAPPPDAPKP
jgi:hypothetical protein